MSTITDEIKARIDLVDLIGRTVALRKSGTNFKGLCPFHQEKTPSFYVFSDSHTWVCFGCGKKGSAFDWLMEREHLDFGEALRTLAQIAGVELSTRHDQQEEEATALLYALLARTQTYYHGLLQGAAGTAARRYLAGRGVAEETIERFGLGYAPGSNALLRYLQEAGFSQDEMLAAGVVSVSDDGRPFDFFRDRVLFPIRDAQGRTVAFGGRCLDDATPKYLNSRDTLLFHKQDIVFGIDLARKPISQERRVVVVEGYMDVLIAHQYGHHNVVATLGTAVTERHLGLLRRLASEIILALDSDAAGQAATWRTLQAAEQSLQVGAKPVLGANRRRVRYVPDRAAQLKILAIPSAKDPDELIRADPSAWGLLVKGAKPVIDFVLSQLEARHDLSTGRGKAAAVGEIAEILAGIANPIEQAHYLQRVADLLKVDEGAVRQALSRTSSRAHQGKGIGGQSEAELAEAGTRSGHEHEGGEGNPLDEYALALLIRSRESGVSTPSGSLSIAADDEFALPESRALARALPDGVGVAPNERLRASVPPALLPYLERVERYLTDVGRLADEQVASELHRVRLEMRKRALLTRQRHARTVMRDAADAEERVRWAQELSDVAHALDSIEQQLQESGTIASRGEGVSAR